MPMPNFTMKIIDFNVNKFNLIMKISLMCFLPLKLPKKKSNFEENFVFGLDLWL